MPAKKTNISGTFLLSSPAPRGGLSVDVGALDLGVESVWTRNNEVVARVVSLSVRAEALSSDHVSTDSWLGTLGAPSGTNSLFISVNGSNKATNEVGPPAMTTKDQDNEEGPGPPGRAGTTRKGRDHQEGPGRKDQNHEEEPRP
ncbi:hypothetical protein F4604DRAFT_1687598 [Suillus subluteus]|nr:hypothetical protein F4604DRAFT_1687598 [Suillus subluteus]